VRLLSFSCPLGVLNHDLMQWLARLRVDSRADLRMAGFLFLPSCSYGSTSPVRRTEGKVDQLVISLQETGGNDEQLLVADC